MPQHLDCFVLYVFVSVVEDNHDVLSRHVDGTQVQVQQIGTSHGEHDERLEIGTRIRRRSERVDRFVIRRRSGGRARGDGVGSRSRRGGVGGWEGCFEGVRATATFFFHLVVESIDQPMCVSSSMLSVEIPLDLT